MNSHFARHGGAQQSIERFIDELAAGGFGGDIETAFATRQVLALDNSIYRVEPLAAIYPRTREDIAIAAKALNRSGAGLSLTARGGGTGTNGQSLNDGIILDTSRYLTGIIDYDKREGRVTVEPGVVLDQLNAFLASDGWFFPPNVSTASRATIGGMAATDASGKGSRQYGRTSDYIEGMDLVFADGDMVSIGSRSRQEDIDITEGHSRLATLYAAIQHELLHAKPYFEAIFPEMNRGLTGYNLKEALLEDGGLNLCKLLAGSEGTLALTASLTLKLRRKPKRSGLLVLFYAHFTQALAHVPALVQADPLAVEILDDKILALARSAPVWGQLSDLFGGLTQSVGAVNFVEVTADTPEEIDGKLAAIRLHVENDAAAFLIRTLTEPESVAAAWSLRASAVGLLGALEGKRKAYPFVEDTAVPPEQLVDYVTAFRALLDAHGVSYGMFGHADVGCLHVRPLLDMTVPKDRALVRTISDGVQALTRAHGGLIWGEHGRGVRGEYLKEVFGPDLYPVVRRIKDIFDPHDRLNPGKIARPLQNDRPLARIDEVPFRGASDSKIAGHLLEPFQKALECNGNGACHDWSPVNPMCPSFKATGDKTQSPNGRAALFRAWARHQTREAEVALARSLDTCLSCRACASSCPVKVDIPTMKARFLDSYHRQRIRPPRDCLIAVMEPVILAARHVGTASNLVLHNQLIACIIRALGLVDLPRFAARSLEYRLAQENFASLDSARPLRATNIILVPDSFLGSFDVEPVLAAARVLRSIGLEPVVAPVLANGKALEVRGFAAAYSRVRDKLQARLRHYAALGVPVIAIEPSITVQARTDGAHFLLSIDEFLAKHMPDRRSSLFDATYRLFLHCTEKTADPAAGQRWQAIFEAAGARLEIVDSGCCGMSGLFGHQREQQDLSREIFDLSWARSLSEGPAMATGFSCRCQVGRFGGGKIAHPLEVLDVLLRDGRMRDAAS